MKSDVAELLRDARARLVAHGWVGGLLDLCEDTDGIPCLSTNPKVKRFSLSGAIARAACDREDLLLGAWSELQRAVSPLRWEEARFYAMHAAEFSPPVKPITDLNRAIWKRALDFARAPRSADVDEWLADPARTQRDVLAMIDKAIHRAGGAHG